MQSEIQKTVQWDFETISLSHHHYSHAKSYTASIPVLWKKYESVVKNKNFKIVKKKMYLNQIGQFFPSLNLLSNALSHVQNIKFQDILWIVLLGSLMRWPPHESHEVATSLRAMRWPPHGFPCVQTCKPTTYSYPWDWQWERGNWRSPWNLSNIAAVWYGTD